jgi:molybdenum cofactor cytidylyltransferase
MSKTKDQRPKTQEVVALLLAAGQSRRMGAFKPLLPFGPTTVIQSCLDNLKAGGIEDVTVVVGHRADDLKAALAELDYVHFVVNPDSSSEMAASIERGIASLAANIQAVLIALTDQPAIPGAVTRQIIDAWHAGAKLVIPEFNGRGGHPVLIDLNYRQELLRLNPESGLKGFFDAHRDQVVRLKVNSSYIARDLDTWDDYRALHEELFGALPDNRTAD